MKQLPAMQSPGSIPGSGTSLENGMATHSSVLAWEILWMEERGLQSMRGKELDTTEVTDTFTFAI